MAKELIKAVLLGGVYFVGCPLLVVAFRRQPSLQRWAFALMCFMVIGGILGPMEFGLTLDSIEWYRGHAKGFYFYFHTVIAIALIIVCRCEKDTSFRWFPPGMVLYLIHCFLCALSIVNAPVKEYVLMAFHKSVFFSVFLVAAYNYLKTEKDIAFFLQVMASVMIFELQVVLKLRYLDGMYQVRGTFEHQNPLSMFSIMIGCVLMMVGLGPNIRGRNLMLAGYIACWGNVVCALSRAGLAVFAAASVGNIIFCLIERPSKRRLITLMSGALGGIVVMILILDTLVVRFGQHGNQESADTREVMKQMCRAMSRDYFLGVGWNNYVHVANPPFSYCEIWWDYERDRGMRVDEERQIGAVESHYYLFLAENGVLGLASYLVFIGVGLWRNVRGFFAFGERPARWMCYGIACGCFVNYVQSGLERVLTQPRNLALWMLLLGVTARLEMIRRTEKKARLAKPL